jgi:hypothetical protein
VLPENVAPLMRANEIGLTLFSVALIAAGQVLFKVAARDAGYDGFNWRTVGMWLTPRHWAGAGAIIGGVWPMSFA